MNTSDSETRARLVEEVVSAHREIDPRGGVIAASAFFDLDDAGRLEAFDQAFQQRAFETALDANHQSTTIKAVLRMLEHG